MNIHPRFFRTAIALSAVLFATGDALKDLRDYRKAGTHPATMSVSDATAASAAMPFVRRWIHLSEPLQLDCSQALYDEGDVEENAATMILALDESRQHAFLLRYRGKLDCDAASQVPMQGMLVPASAKFWTVHGMTVPATSYPLMELQVGSDPKGLLREAEVLAGVVAVSLALLWYLWVFPKTKRSLIAPEGGFAKAARAP